MRKDFVCRTIFLATLACLATAQTAVAQASDNDPKDVRGSYATKYARYYAPYALHATAAYIDVDRFNRLLGPDGQPNMDGADVRLAVEPFNGNARAVKYFQSWQYQFGSTGYLTCFEANPDCLRIIGRDRNLRPVAGGPTFHVWARTGATRRAGAACTEVSIAFRGSTSSFSDWASNFDVVSGYVYDNEYRQLRRNIDGIIRKIVNLDCFKRANGAAQIVSVGHSLGGGLAQLAALANNPSRPRITKVFAFDPSPVTGASYVDAAVYNTNVTGLEIDRVYQIGEVLQPLRAVVQQKPSAAQPCVRSVRFDLTRTNSPLDRHSWGRVAGDLVDLAYDTGEQQKFIAAPAMADCKSRYRRPVTDEDPPPANASDPQAVALAPSVQPNRIASAPLDRTLFAHAGSGDVAESRGIAVDLRPGSAGPRKKGGRPSHASRLAGQKVWTDVSAGGALTF